MRGIKDARRRLVTVLVVLLLLALALAAAIAFIPALQRFLGIGTQKTISKDGVVDQIGQRMTDPDGHGPDSASCPHDLDAVVGATVDCVMTFGGQTYAVEVTVTSIDGQTVNFDIVRHGLAGASR